MPPNSLFKELIWTRWTRKENTRKVLLHQHCESFVIIFCKFSCRHDCCSQGKIVSLRYFVLITLFLIIFKRLYYQCRKKGAYRPGQKRCKWLKCKKLKRMSLTWKNAGSMWRVCDKRCWHTSIFLYIIPSTLARWSWFRLHCQLQRPTRMVFKYLMWLQESIPSSVL